MNYRCSVVPHSCLRLVVAIALLAIAPTKALKHNYYTKHDGRRLIGPLGFPFGFLDNGHYNLTVYDFKLSRMKNAHSHYNSHSLATANKKDCHDDNSCLTEMLEKIKGVGFLLKQFEDEAHFHHYMEDKEDHPDQCIFQQYLDEDLEPDDDFDFFEYSFGVDDAFSEDYLDDEFPFRKHNMKRKLEEQGFGETLNATKDGIYVDMLPLTHWGSNNVPVAYNFRKGEAGLYFLIYQVCMKDPKDNVDIHSRFELDFHFSNRDIFNRVSYLSRGEMNLPWLFLAFTILYAVCLYIWNAHIRLIKEGKTGYFNVGDEPATAAPTIPGAAATPDVPTIYPIHYLMGFLLTLKFCTLLFEAVRYHYLRVTGHAVFFSVVYYIFTFLKGMTLFTVILLIGSGWSFVKSFLSDREKKMILGVLVLQVINNIAIVVLSQETEGEVSFDRWTAILHLVDIVCCCAVLLPIVWQVNQLEKNIQQNQHKGIEDDEGGKNDSEEAAFINNKNDQFVDEDNHIPENEIDDASLNGDESSEEIIPDERMVAKLKMFRSFYLLVIAYIYMTRIVVYLFAASLDYKHTWIPIFIVELTTFFFYTGVGYMFRPVNENPYLHFKSRKNRKNDESQVEMRRIDPSTKTALD